MISQCENLSAAAFSLINFDCHQGVLKNPHWLPIQEKWYLYWLENANLD
jgi:hypothetical protein